MVHAINNNSLDDKSGFGVIIHYCKALLLEFSKVKYVCMFAYRFANVTTHTLVVGSHFDARLREWLYEPP